MSWQYGQTGRTSGIALLRTLDEGGADREDAKPPETGPRRLVRAILAEAIATYRGGLVRSRKNFGTNTFYNRREWRTAGQWIRGGAVDAKSGCFSFQQCCDYLGLNAQQVRTAVLDKSNKKLSLRHLGY